MTEPTHTPDRRKSQSVTTIKDDLQNILALEEDQAGGVLRIIQTVQGLTESIGKVIQDIGGVKTTETEVATHVTALHDLTAHLFTDLDAVQEVTSGMQGSMETMHKSQTKAMTLVSGTLLDVYDALQSVQGQLIGLTTQVQSKTCPWKPGGPEVAPEEILTSLQILTKLAPTLEIMVREDLKSRGFDADGQPKEGLFQFFDKIKASFINICFTLVAGSAIGLVLSLNSQYRANGEKLTEMLKQQPTGTKYQELVKANAEQTRVIQALQGKKPSAVQAAP